MSHTYTARLPRARSASRGDQVVDEIARDHIAARTRASASLVVAWASLAVAIAVYAIDRGSIGAAILAVVVTWQTTATWRAVVSRHSEPPPRQITFR
jgi:hypothetical protein